MGIEKYFPGSFESDQIEEVGAKKIDNSTYYCIDRLIQDKTYRGVYEPITFSRTKGFKYFLRNSFELNID